METEGSCFFEKNSDKKIRNTHEHFGFRGRQLIDFNPDS